MKKINKKNFRKFTGLLFLVMAIQCPTVIAMPVPSKIDPKIKHCQSLYTDADSAMKAQRWDVAEVLFKDLLKQDALARVDIWSIGDVFLKLALAQMKQNKYKEASDLLDRLDPMKLSRDSYKEKELLKAQILQMQQKPQQAYLVLRELEKKVPFRTWTGPEKAKMIALEFELNNHYQDLQVQVNRWLKEGRFVIAKKLLNTLMQAIEQGFYPEGQNPQVVLKIREKSLECAARYQKNILEASQPKAYQSPP